MLGTMTLYGGFPIVITKGYVISNFPKEFVFIGSGTVPGVPLAVIVLALIILQVISSGLNLLKVSTFVTLSLGLRGSPSRSAAAPPPRGRRGETRS